MKKNIKEFTQLPVDWQNSIEEFIGSNIHIPEAVKIAFELLKDLEKRLNTKSFTQKALSEYLKISMGIIPSSEKHANNSSAKKIKAKPKKISEMTEDEKLAYYKAVLKSRNKQGKHARKKIKEIMQKKKGYPVAKPNNPPPEPIYDDEDEEYEQPFTDSQMTDALKSNSGDGEAFAKNTAPIFSSPSLMPKKSTINIKAERFPGEKWRSGIQITNKCDFTFQVNSIEVEKEILTDSITGEHRSADTSNIGPKGAIFTWNAIANFTILVVGYAFPMHRLQRLLGHKLFSIPNMVRHLDNLANISLPIYQYQYKTLANARIIEGDDTYIRVNEVTKWKVSLKKERIKNPNAVIAKPWDARNSPNKQKASPTLMTRLNEDIGFYFTKIKSSKKENPKESKETLLATVASGLENELDPTSRIVIYRSHFGSFGNFANTILKYRKPENKELIILSDLSSTNCLDASNLKRFNVKHAGCAAHARRPFKRNFSQEPEICEYILTQFNLIAETENMIDSFGRNSANTLKSRQLMSKFHWDELLDICKEAAQAWSKETPIGKGLRYIIKNFDKLVLYCTDAFIPPTNNRIENLARYEALEDNSSFGRDTLEGRARYDIIRTQLATCSYAGANPHEYFIFLLTADKAEIENNPESYTPQAFVRWIKHQLPTISTSELLAQKAASRARIIANQKFS